MWFPKPGGHQTARMAQLICLTCTVARQCLEFAIEHEEEHGIWGGRTANQRRADPGATGIEVLGTRPERDSIAAVCSFPDCGRKRRAHGLCDAHNRQHLAGHPLTAINRATRLAARRFWRESRDQHP